MDFVVQPSRSLRRMKPVPPFHKENLIKTNVKFETRTGGKRSRELPAMLPDLGDNFKR